MKKFILFFLLLIVSALAQNNNQDNQKLFYALQKQIFQKINSETTSLKKQHSSLHLNIKNSLIAVVTIEDTSSCMSPLMCKPVSCWKYDKSNIIETDTSEYFKRIDLDPKNKNRYPVILIYFEKQENENILNIYFILNRLTGKLYTRKIHESNGSYTLSE